MMKGDDQGLVIALLLLYKYAFRRVRFIDKARSEPASAPHPPAGTFSPFYG
jgi:hypothetical protein